MCIGCGDASVQDLNAKQAVVVDGSGAITADQICSQLTSDEVGRAIGRTIVRHAAATTHGIGSTHTCSYYFGKLDRDRVEVSIALDDAARTSLGDAPWPPPLHFRCESVGVGANEAGGCEAILAEGIRARVSGRGEVVSPSAGRSLIAALRNQP
jgi:hypothetical protein